MPTGTNPQGTGFFISQLVPVIFAFIVLTYFTNRSQAKKQKQFQEFLAQLKRGDQVVTTGGIFGRIEGVAENFVTLEISDSVRIKVLKSQINAMPSPALKNSSSSSQVLNNNTNSSSNSSNNKSVEART